MIDLRFTPLDKWPGEQTRNRQDARFRASYGETLKLLDYELRKLYAKEITIQAFFRANQLRNDGWPLSKSVPSAPGLILSFRTKDGPLSFPCDRYRTFDDNLRAIALSLQALRAVDRYGVTKRNEQYAGWKRIEAAPVNGFASKEDAARFMVAHQDTNIAAYSVIADAGLRSAVYRRAAGRLHPDNPNTGNHDLFVKLQQANSMLENT